jgi:hydrogenase maturation factor HypF (carbamoyltransferase family)
MADRDRKVQMAKELFCPGSTKRMTRNVHTVSVCCPTCGQYVRLRKDGRMMKHKPAANSDERLKQTADAIRNWKAGTKSEG